MASETGLKSRILEIVRSSKEQKEPVLEGSEYEDTKKVTQFYQEMNNYLKKKMVEAEGTLAASRRKNHNCRIVGPGHQVKGYALIIPVHDDYDMAEELDAAIGSMKLSFGLQLYLEGPMNHGEMVHHPYEVQELSLIFPEFMTYNFVGEMEAMKCSFQAAYDVQRYTGAVKAINEAVFYEVNAATIRGNVELAERLKESDTTLLVAMAAAGQSEPQKEPEKKVSAEPTDAEVESALQTMAEEDLEIRTPSTIYEKPTEDRSVGVEIVNIPRSIRRKKIRDRTKGKPMERAKA